MWYGFLTVEYWILGICYQRLEFKIHSIYQNHNRSHNRLIKTRKSTQLIIYMMKMQFSIYPAITCKRKNVSNIKLHRKVLLQKIISLFYQIKVQIMFSAQYQTNVNFPVVGFCLVFGTNNEKAIVVFNKPNWHSALFFSWIIKMLMREPKYNAQRQTITYAWSSIRINVGIVGRFFFYSRLVSALNGLNIDWWYSFVWKWLVWNMKTCTYAELWLR